MTKNQRILIEHNLLRPGVVTIQRNDAGKSNWQSWHNGMKVELLDIHVV